MAPAGPSAFELASHLSKNADLFAVVSQDADYIDYWRKSGFTVIEVPTFKTKLEAAISLIRRQPIAYLGISHLVHASRCPFVSDGAPLDACTAEAFGPYSGRDDGARSRCSPRHCSSDEQLLGNTIGANGVTMRSSQRSVCW